MRSFRVIVLFVMLLVLIQSYSFASSEPSVWALETIEKVKGYNLLDENRMFNNYLSRITRGDFAYIAVNLYNKLMEDSDSITSATSSETPFPSNKSVVFKDTNDLWIIKAKELGIVNGYSDGTFKPLNPVSRQEIAVMLVKVMELTKIELKKPTSVKFNDDSSIATWAKNAVYLSRENDIVKGANNNFYPLKYCTREEALVLFNRCYEKFALLAGENKEVAKPTLTPQEAFSLEVNKMTLHNYGTFVRVSNQMEIRIDSTTVENYETVSYLRINYTMKNVSGDPIGEETLQLFFDDGTSNYAGGIFLQSILPNQTYSRSVTIGYPKGVKPVFIATFDMSKFFEKVDYTTITKWRVQ